MKIHCIWEHNGEDTLLYAADYPGAYARGTSLQEAAEKLPSEVHSYQRWAGLTEESDEAEIVQEKASDLAIRDADSDVIFDCERTALTMTEYQALKALVMKSARDFQALYDSIPSKDQSSLPVRSTFYGRVPRTAREMYEHTKNVNDYYFGEINVPADHDGTIAECRERGFAALEQIPDFLLREPCEGSYGEEWSLRKVMRRFLWHDRIHAKAMYRMAVKTFGADKVKNPFCF